MEINLQTKEFYIKVNDVFVDLNEENQKLKNELIFANNCLNVFNKFKLLLNEICIKYEENIVFEDKLKLNQLNDEYNSIITSTEPMNNCLMEFYSDSEDVTADEMIVELEPLLYLDDLTNKESNDMNTHFERLDSFESNENQFPKEITNPFKCGKCDQTFVTKKSLKAHEVIHREIVQQLERHSKLRNIKRSPKKTIDCHYEGCLQSFQSFADKQLHIKTIHTIKPLKCGECDQRFTNKYTLKTHQLIGCGNGLECKECHKVFTKKYLLKRHIKKHPRYVCNYFGCGQRFGTIVLRNNHFRYKHKFKCEECKQTFGTNHELNVHKELHMRTKFECKECHKVFNTEILLKRHMKTHSLRFVCQSEGCDQRFLSMSQRNIHFRSKHTFECKECHEVFNKKTLLSQHMTKHFSIFVCHRKRCHQRFRSISLLEEHIQAIHRIKCKECDQKFYSYPKLKVHQQIHSN